MIGAVVLRPNRIPRVAPGQDQRLPHSERLLEFRVGELLDLLRVLEPALVSGRSVGRVVSENVKVRFSSYLRNANKEQNILTSLGCASGPF